MSDRDDEEFARQVAQLGSRRKVLGVTQQEMANGLRWSLRDVLDVEKGVASDAYLLMYHDWLDRLERMNADARQSAIARARDGSRFTA